MNLPYCKSPCGNCPFRKDTLEGWLGEKRMTEILEQDSFVCHKNNKLQCAGHMIINGNNNAFVRFAKGFNIDLNLRNKDLIFSTKKECINHHK